MQAVTAGSCSLVPPLSKAITLVSCVPSFVPASEAAKRDNAPFETPPSAINRPSTHHQDRSHNNLDFSFSVNT